jgi:hypothetical protein
MKKRKVVISVLSVIVLIETVGIILNRVVMSANGGMPTVVVKEAFDKWVPLNPGTRFPFLSDVIQVGYYAVSIGDLLLLTGIAANMVAIWMAFPPSRKFFPILIVSFLGILWSIAEPNMMSAFLCETVAVGTILVIFWKCRSILKKVTSGSELPK